MKNIFKKILLVGIVLMPVMSVNASCDTKLSDEDFEKLKTLDYSNSTETNNCLDKNSCRSNTKIENGKVVLTIDEDGYSDSGPVKRDVKTFTINEITNPVSVKGYEISQGDGVVADYVLTKDGSVYYVHADLMSIYNDGGTPKVEKLDVSNIKSIALDETNVLEQEYQEGELPSEDECNIYQNDIRTFFMIDNNDIYYFSSGSIGKILNSIKPANSESESKAEDESVSNNEVSIGSFDLTTYAIIISILVVVLIIALIVVVARNKKKE